MQEHELSDHPHKCALTNIVTDDRKDKCNNSCIVVKDEEKHSYALQIVIHLKTCVESGLSTFFV